LRHSGSPEVEVRARAREAELVLTVADRGKGVPRAERQRVFEPFTRLDGTSATPGTGLGLAIVREIAEAHGGSVVVRDRDGGPGAEFEIALPLAGGGESLP
jgi:signal transduction histidine kinase